MLARDDIDLVYIATPPFLHHPQAHGGPPGRQARDLREAAGDDRRPGRRDDRRRAPPRPAARGQPDAALQPRSRRGPPAGRNQGARRDAPRQLRELRLRREPAGPSHWFWDRSKSGGIFVEHGVHFFDLFAGWLGPGKVEAAQVGVAARGLAADRGARPVHRAIRRRHPRQLLSRLPPGRPDGPAGAPPRVRARRRHALRVGADAGQGSTPSSTRRRPAPSAISSPAPGSTSRWPTAQGSRLPRARDKALDVYQMVELAWGEGSQKSHRYGELLRAVMADQARLGPRPSPPRKITEKNGRDSLAVACEADRLAHQVEAEDDHLSDSYATPAPSRRRPAVA